jgi:2-hydroxychromene-2-carboxylate isomerase
MQGVWSEGIDAGRDGGLRPIVERAGLNWSEARNALADEAWRTTAGASRAELFALGLWGVPSIRVGDTAVWGQDRPWAVQEALQRPTDADPHQVTHRLAVATGLDGGCA